MVYDRASKRVVATGNVAGAQGVILGALLQGVTVSNRAYAGEWLDWLSPFSLVTGISVVCGYALLGATWLIWKTDGRTQAHACRLAGLAFGATLVAIVLVFGAWLLRREPADETRA